MNSTIRVAWLLALVACGGTDSSNLFDGSTNDTGVPGNDGGGPTTDGGGPTTDGGGPTTDGAPTTDAGTWTPASVNGLVLWLEGNVGSSITTSNGRVTKWSDQTSHHNDANGSTSSTTQMRNPTVKTGQINSLDVIHFSKGQSNGPANMLVIPDNTDQSLQWGTGDFFVAIVGEFDNDPQDSSGASFQAGNFFAKNIAPNQATLTGVAMYGNIPPSQQSVALTGFVGMASNAPTNFVFTTTAYNTNKPHVFALRRQGKTLDLFVDGASVASATATSNVDVSNPNVPVRIGADGDANLLRLDGDIGEMLAVKGALAPSDQTSLQAYLKAKWGTP